MLDVKRIQLNKKLKVEKTRQTNTNKQRAVILIIKSDKAVFKANILKGIFNDFIIIKNKIQ